MPRKFELTWQAGTGSWQGRWKKKYKGRTLYLGSAGSKSDLEAYREALAIWQTTKAEIDAEEAARPQPLQEEYEAAIREWDQVLRWSFEHGDEASATAARLKLAELRQRRAGVCPRSGHGLLDRSEDAELSRDLPGSGMGQPVR